ncbi:MAG: sugar ABC transporter permease [Eubacterium sp.]|jgi:multiple sugar transport system permease protein|nr:sugar ABC transporter permease [Eubacterium sp.]
MKLQKKQNRMGVLLVSPFFIGCTVFYFAPFIISIYYSFTSGGKEKQFVGINNYIQLFQNQSFLLALKNTVLFMGIGIPILLCTGLLLAKFLCYLSKFADTVRGVLIVPFVIPVASVIKVWQILFDDYGILNRIFTEFSLETQQFFQNGWVFFVLILIFIWKNCGYVALIYSVAMSNIPGNYVDAARMDGAGKWKIFYKIVLPLLRPTTFFALLISIINSFKIFREVYLLTGQYPDTKVYFIQHFMNNNFYNLNYPKLSSASVILSVLIVFVVLIIFLRERGGNYESEG